MNNLFILLLTFLDDTSSDYPSLPDGETFLEKIIPNLWAFIIQLLSLIVLIVLFFIFAYKPIKRIIKKRQDAVDEEIKSAFLNNEQSKKDLQESKDLLSDARKRSDEMIEEAKKSALEETKIIQEQSKEEIRQLKIKADEDIKAKYEALKDDIHKEIVDVSILATNKLLNKNITSDDNKKIVDDFIDEVNK